MCQYKNTELSINSVDLPLITKALWDLLLQISSLKLGLRQANHLLLGMGTKHTLWWKHFSGKLQSNSSFGGAFDFLVL